MTLPEQLGRLRRVRPLGAGGFASVWLYRDDELDSLVAVKALADQWRDDPDIRERFLAEARLLRQVESPHVVDVYDIGVTADGTPYFVMSYADLGSVADRASRQPPVSPAELVDLVGQAADGLAAMHARGIVHRDIKPANLLLSTDAAEPGGVRVRVADLGVAKSVTLDPLVSRVVGTPAYMAPEQHDPELPVDGRVDVRALGAVAYRLISGRAPRVPQWPGQPVEPLSAYAGVPSDVERVVMVALEPDRDRRWRTAPEFAAALRAAVEGRTVAAPPAAAPRRRRRGLLAAAATLVLVVGGATGAWLLRPDDAGNAAAAGSASSSASDVPSTPAFPAVDGPAPPGATFALGEPALVSVGGNDWAGEARIIVESVEKGTGVDLAGVPDAALPEGHASMTPWLVRVRARGEGPLIRDYAITSELDGVIGGRRQPAYRPGDDAPGTCSGATITDLLAQEGCFVVFTDGTPLDAVEFASPGSSYVRAQNTQVRWAVDEAAGAAGGGIELTAPGTELRYGDTAVVPDSSLNKAVLEISVTGVERASDLTLEDVDFLDPWEGSPSAAVYRVHATLAATSGQTALLPHNFLDGWDGEQMLATEAAKAGTRGCETVSELSPRPGEVLETCVLVVVDEGERLDGIAFASVATEYDPWDGLPVVWRP